MPALLEASRWRSPVDTSACRCWRLHWSEGASEHVQALLAPFWHGGPVPARQGSTHMPGWDKAPLRRLVLVEGYVVALETHVKCNMFNFQFQFLKGAKC